MKRAEDKEPPLPCSPRLRAQGPTPLRATVQTLPKNAPAYSPFGLGEVCVVGLVVVTVVPHLPVLTQGLAAQKKTTGLFNHEQHPDASGSTVRLAKGALACGSAARDRRASWALARSHYRVWVPPLAARLGRISHSRGGACDSPMPLRCPVTSPNRAACGCPRAGHNVAILPRGDRGVGGSCCDRCICACPVLKWAE